MYFPYHCKLLNSCPHVCGIWCWREGRQTPGYLRKLPSKQQQQQKDPFCRKSGSNAALSLLTNPAAETRTMWVNGAFIIRQLLCFLSAWPRHRRSATKEKGQLGTVRSVGNRCVCQMELLVEELPEPANLSGLSGCASINCCIWLPIYSTTRHVTMYDKM